MRYLAIGFALVQVTLATYLSVLIPAEAVVGFGPIAIGASEASLRENGFITASGHYGYDEKNWCTHAGGVYLFAGINGGHPSSLSIARHEYEAYWQVCVLNDKAIWIQAWVDQVHFDTVEQLLNARDWMVNEFQSAGVPMQERWGNGGAYYTGNGRDGNIAEVSTGDNGYLYVLIYTREASRLMNAYNSGGSGLH